MIFCSECGGFLKEFVKKNRKTFGKCINGHENLLDSPSLSKLGKLLGASTRQGKRES